MYQNLNFPSDDIENDEDHKECIKNGFLWKRSSKLLVGWQKRFFTLSNHRFCYYTNQEDTIPKGIFNFERINAYLVTVPAEKKKFSMFVEGLKREFKFRADTEKDRVEWTAALLSQIEEAKSSKAKDMTLVTVPNFWKK